MKVNKVRPIFTLEQLVVLKKGIKRMFDELGITTTIRIVRTSQRSVSLYISFPKDIISTVRISSHEPNYGQQHYNNIFIKEK